MTVPVVKEVHQGASEKEEIGQKPQKMRPVLREKEKACNKQEAQQYPHTATGSGVIMLMCMVHRYLLGFSFCEESMDRRR